MCTLVPLLILFFFSSPLLCEKSDETIKLLSVGSWGTGLPNATSSVRLMTFAAELINNSTEILPNAQIVIEVRNCGGGTSGNPSTCIVQTTQGLMEGNISGVLSGAYVADQRVIQYASAAFGLPQVAGASSGPIMSNKHEYPTFMRTCPSDGLADTALINVMVKMGWKNAIMCLEDGDWGAGNKDILNGLAAANGINIESILCPTGSNNFTAQAAYVKQKKYNVVIPMLNSREAYLFLDAANATGLFGPQYVWLLPLTVVSAQPANVLNLVPWIDAYGLRKLLKGAIGFIATGANGPRYVEMLPLWTQYANITASAYTWYQFDAVWTYALAYNELMSQGMRVADINGSVLLKTMMNLEFNGTTGWVYFDQYGDRQGLINVHSVTESSLPVVALYDPVSQNFTKDLNFTFFDGTTNVPPDLVEICVCSGHGECTVDFVCICDSGYHGSYCSIKKKQETVLIEVLVPVLGSAILLLTAVGFWYKRKHASLIKDIADRQQSDIPRNEIQLQSRIGAGGAGEVYTAMFRGTQVAVKQILATKMSQQTKQEFQLECAIMCSLRHPNIVLFMGSCYDEKSNEMLLVMEYMQKGSLHDVLHNKSIALPFTLQIHLAYQTAQGINFLHQCNPPIIHGDIKSHNVLLDGKWCARISDFGMTKLAKFSQKGSKQGDSDRRSIGTIFWAAPEVLNGSHQSKQSDCYSFAVTLYEIFERKDPYPAGDPLYIAHQVAQFGLRPAIDTAIPPKVASLIQRCWAEDPLKRPSFDDITRELCDILMVSGDDIISKPSLASNVFIVATEVDNASIIWDNYPNDMRDATMMLNEMIRQQLGPFHGHETDYEDERFYVTFSQLEDALNWCLNTQTKILSLKWPQAFAHYPSTAMKIGPNGAVARNGLRVNMAVHMGMPISRHDQKPDAADIAVKGNLLEILGHIQGGEILVSNAVRTAMVSAEPVLIEETLLVKHHDVHNESRIQESTYILAKRKGNVNGDLQLDDVTSPLLTSASDDDTLPHTILDISELNTKNRETTKYNRAKWDITYSDLQLTDKIGKSYIGEVFKTNVNGNMVAVKHYFSNYNEEILLEYKSIVTTASKFSHPNVVKYVGLTIDPHVTLIQEFVPCTTLKEYLKGALPDREKIRIAREIAEGMKYLSNQHDDRFAIHPNFRSSNVFVGKNQATKVADYALGILYDTMRTITAVESVIWTAPEVFQGGTPTPAASVYSFSMLMWEIFAQKQPFENIHPIKLIAHVLEGQRPPVSDEWPSGCKSVMQRCWATNPHARPSWTEICAALQ